MGESSATPKVSETFKEEGRHALKADLKFFSPLNALHSLRSGLFNLTFEVTLSFKLNSSWSVTNLLEKLHFSKGILKPELSMGLWISIPALFLVCIYSVQKQAFLWSCESHGFCFTLEETRMRYTNTLKGHLLPSWQSCMNKF